MRSSLRSASRAQEPVLSCVVSKDQTCKCPHGGERQNARYIEGSYSGSLHTDEAPCPQSVLFPLGDHDYQTFFEQCAVATRPLLVFYIHYCSRGTASSPLRSCIRVQTARISFAYS